MSFWRTSISRYPLVFLIVFALSNTACLSIHKDVFGSRLPGDTTSVYTILKQRAPAGVMPSRGETPTEVTLATPAQAFGDTPIVRLFENVLLAHAVGNDTATCIPREAVANAQASVKALHARIGHFKEFMDAIVQRDRDAGRPRPLVRALMLDPAPRDTAPTSVSVSFGHFLAGYLAAYANGAFVDRDGTHWSKPTIDKDKRMISNDTITAFVTVVSEAIVDHFFYRYRACLSFPIVLGDDAGKPVWLTVGGSMPTLARVLGLNDTTTGGMIPAELRGIIERATTGNEGPGIGPRKLKIIRLVGGVGGDEGKMVSGLVLRNFGGIHFGQFILGKWSIGDNDTVAKVAEAVIDLLAKRANQAIASQALYTPPFPDGLQWIVGAAE